MERVDQFRQRQLDVKLPGLRRMMEQVERPAYGYLKELFLSGVPSPLLFQHFPITPFETSCLLEGPNTTGKTTAAIMDLKQTLLLGRTAHYMTLAEFLRHNTPSDDPEVWQYLLSRDLVVLDELGKNYDKPGSDFNSSKIEELIRALFNYGTRVTLVTNYSKDDLEEKLTPSTLALIQRSCTIVPFYTPIKDVDNEANMVEFYKEAEHFEENRS